jgi:two-component system, NarL family, sensor kinase
VCRSPWKKLPALSPAVELAAYRIAVEGIANALRHSTGQSCRVAVTAGDDLEVTVTDDGASPAQWRPGVGLRSIDARAEELGGTARAAPDVSGWTVRARLPIQR